MRNLKTEGVVIKRNNIGEADKILTVFTKNEGKISIKANGIRRVPSRRSAHVELLNHSHMTLYVGLRLPILTEVQTISTFSEIKEDLTKVGFAYHICELIDGLLPERQENRTVFFLLCNTLSTLNTQCDTVLTVHEFEVELLTLLGYWHKPQVESRNIDMLNFIENILERRLKSRKIFNKLS